MSYVAQRLGEPASVPVRVWDTHGSNFSHLKQYLPLFDRGISTLVEDIHMRGLDKDVTVVVWGEFGRSPKINAQAGRDHWAPVNSALLAGGGMKVGQVIGSTDKLGGSALSSPIHYLDVLATVYHNLGIDPHSFVPDISGRPVPILPGTAKPIAKLV
jgi:arylsulfatase A-like enzyme